MAIKVSKSYTPARRQMSFVDSSDITKKEPEKKLIIALKKKGGRNNTGRITVRHRGGGHKRYYRFIDFKRDKLNIKAKVVAIEYDPNRSAKIALVEYEDGEKRYIICPLGLKVGDEICSGPDAEIKIGNALPLENIPPGTVVHNIELIPNKGGIFCRSAGSWAQVLSKEKEYVSVKFPSGEIRLLPLKCMATIGQVGNPERESISLGKAGRSRWLGRRPTVRGVAMRPVDHPHGGGKGKGKGGNIPTSFSKVLAKGGKTRKEKVWDWMIIKRRQEVVRK